MALINGIQSIFRKTANQAVAASVTLVSLGLLIPVAINQRIHIRFTGGFTIGASGGFKFQFVVPAAPTSFNNVCTVIDTVTPGVLGTVQTSSAAFANALAVAGTHSLYMDLDFVNGATAGNIDFQFACNSAANGITMLLGATVEAWIQ
jgi:hypothetical protein